MALITLMVFNALIMAISLSQPNSPHSINETPGLQSIKKTPGLLHSISTQRHTTFGEAPSDPRGGSLRSPMRLQIDPRSDTRSDTSLGSNSDSQQLLDYLGLLHPVLLQTKGSHLTLGLLQPETLRLPLRPSALT